MNADARLHGTLSSAAQVLKKLTNLVVPVDERLLLLIIESALLEFVSVKQLPIPRKHHDVYLSLYLE